MNLNRWINWKHRRWIIVNSKWLECVWDSNIDPILRHVAEDRNGHGLPRVTYYSSGCSEQRCCWYDWCTGERLLKHLLTNLLLMLWCFQLPHRLYMCLYMCLYISLLHCVPHTLCQMQNMGPWGLACRSVWRSAWWSLLWSTSTAKSWIKDDRASDSDRKNRSRRKDISHDSFGSSATDAAVSLKDLERFWELPETFESFGIAGDFQSVTRHYPGALHGSSQA